MECLSRGSGSLMGSPRKTNVRKNEESFRRSDAGSRDDSPKKIFPFHDEREEPPRKATSQGSTEESCSRSGGDDGRYEHGGSRDRGGRDSQRGNLDRKQTRDSATSPIQVKTARGSGERGDSDSFRGHREVTTTDSATSPTMMTENGRSFESSKSRGSKSRASSADRDSRSKCSESHIRPGSKGTPRSSRTSRTSSGSARGGSKRGSSTDRRKSPGSKPSKNPFDNPDLEAKEEPNSSEVLDKKGLDSIHLEFLRLQKGISKKPSGNSKCSGSMSLFSIENEEDQYGESTFTLSKGRGTSAREDGRTDSQDEGLSETGNTVTSMSQEGEYMTSNADKEKNTKLLKMLSRKQTGMSKTSKESRSESPGWSESTGGTSTRLGEGENFGADESSNNLSKFGYESESMAMSKSKTGQSRSLSGGKSGGSGGLNGSKSGNLSGRQSENLSDRESLSKKQPEAGGPSGTESGGFSRDETGGLSKAAEATGGTLGGLSEGEGESTAASDYDAKNYSFQSDEHCHEIYQTDIPNSEAQSEAGSQKSAGSTVSSIKTIQDGTNSAFSSDSKSGTTQIAFIRRLSPSPGYARGDIIRRSDNNHRVLTPAKPEDIPTSRSAANFSKITEMKPQANDIPKLKLLTEAEPVRIGSMSSLDILSQEPAYSYAEVAKKPEEDWKSSATYQKPVSLFGGFLSSNNSRSVGKSITEENENVDTLRSDVSRKFDFTESKRHKLLSLGNRVSRKRISCESGWD